MMSEKKSREKRQLDHAAIVEKAKKRREQQELPLPVNSSNPYSITMKDSLTGRFLWQLRPKPLMRRMILVAMVGPIYCFFLKPIADWPLVEKLPWIIGSALAGPLLYAVITAMISLIVGLMSHGIKQKQFTDAILYWDDDRVEWVSPIYTQKFTWKQFKAHFVTKKLIILALQGTIISIPTRAFKNAADLEKFSNLATEKAVGFRIKLPPKNANS